MVDRNEEDWIGSCMIYQVKSRKRVVVTWAMITAERMGRRDSIDRCSGGKIEFKRTWWLAENGEIVRELSKISPRCLRSFLLERNIGNKIMSFRNVEFVMPVTRARGTVSAGSVVGSWLYGREFQREAQTLEHRDYDWHQRSGCNHTHGEQEERRTQTESQETSI